MTNTPHNIFDHNYNQQKYIWKNVLMVHMCTKFHCNLIQTVKVFFSINSHIQCHHTSNGTQLCNCEASHTKHAKTSTSDVNDEKQVPMQSQNKHESSAFLTHINQQAIPYRVSHITLCFREQKVGQ